MKHQSFRDKIVLAHYRELTPEQESDLFAHIEGCPSCRLEFEETGRMLSMLDEETVNPLQEGMMEAARRRLELALDRRQAGKPNPEPNGLWERLLRFLRPWIPAFSLAAASLAVGVAVGHLMSTTPGVDRDPLSSILSDPQARLSQVRIAQPDPDSTQMQVQFTAARSYQLSGDIENPDIQRILAHALLAEQNPGTRLRAVSVLATHQPEDPEAITALIGALRTDPNPGVRLRALAALRRYPPSEPIQRAFVDVLAQDDNAKLRIGAIEALEYMLTRGSALGTELAESVERSLARDDNQVVQRKSRDFLRLAGYTLN